MAGLADMEELIAKVGNIEAASYLREAFVCYGAGAYRACIILTYGALFEDIRLKTFNVAKVSASAKTVSTQIELLANGQKPFETPLVEQLKSQNLITELQSQCLKQIINHRNKAAHPSGHIANAEEARYVFREAVDRFLSQPVLSTTQAVDEILVDITSSNYFPSKQLDDVQQIVSVAIQPVHSAAHKALVERLVAALLSPLSEDNARKFLLGLIRTDAPYWRTLISRALLEKRSANPAFGIHIYALLCIDGKIFSISNSATKQRTAKLIAEQVNNVVELRNHQIHHPVVLLLSLIVSVSPEDIDICDDFVQKVINKYWKMDSLLRSAERSPKVLEKLIEVLISKAGSTNYDTANEFARTLPSFDKGLSKLITDRQAFQIAVGVIKASEGGAFNAQDITSDKFSSAPEVKAKAKAFATSPESVATNFDGLADPSDVSKYLAGALA